jgi:hypothetical protein
MIREGGITGTVTHAIKQGISAVPVNQGERTPR